MDQREDWMNIPDQANLELRQSIQSARDHRYPPDSQFNPTARQERRKHAEQLIAYSVSRPR